MCNIIGKQTTLVIWASKWCAIHATNVKTHRKLPEEIYKIGHFLNLGGHFVTEFLTDYAAHGLGEPSVVLKIHKAKGDICEKKYVNKF